MSQDNEWKKAVIDGKTIEYAGADPTEKVAPRNPFEDLGKEETSSYQSPLADPRITKEERTSIMHQANDLVQKGFPQESLDNPEAWHDLSIFRAQEETRLARELLAEKTGTKAPGSWAEEIEDFVTSKAAGQGMERGSSGTPAKPEEK